MRTEFWILGLIVMRLLDVIGASSVDDICSVRFEDRGIFDAFLLADEGRGEESDRDSSNGAGLPVRDLWSRLYVDGAGGMEPRRRGDVFVPGEAELRNSNGDDGANSAD